MTVIIVCLLLLLLIAWYNLVLQNNTKYIIACSKFYCTISDFQVTELNKVLNSSNRINKACIFRCHKTYINKK